MTLVTYSLAYHTSQGVNPSTLTVSDILVGDKQSCIYTFHTQDECALRSKSSSVAQQMHIVNRSIRTFIARANLTAVGHLLS
jgi:hypothetical protein